MWLAAGPTPPPPRQWPAQFVSRIPPIWSVRAPPLTYLNWQLKRHSNGYKNWDVPVCIIVWSLCLSTSYLKKVPVPTALFHTPRPFPLTPKKVEVIRPTKVPKMISWWLCVCVCFVCLLTKLGDGRSSSESVAEYVRESPLQLIVDQEEQIWSVIHSTSMILTCLSRRWDRRGWRSERRGVSTSQPLYIGRYGKYVEYRTVEYLEVGNFSRRQTYESRGIERNLQKFLRSYAQKALCNSKG